MVALRKPALLLAASLVVGLRLSATLAWSEARAGDSLTSSPTTRATVVDAMHRAVGILNYVIGDYPIAVGPDGGIRNEAEYLEQVVLLEDVDRILAAAAADAPSSDPSGAPDEGLRTLRQWVQERRAPDAVQEQAAALRDTLIARNSLVLAPTKLPSLARGRQLYASACAACHGNIGRAQTPIADRLDPRPTDLLSRHLDQTLSPYQAFNVVTYGVAGTSMPSFEVLSVSERWDIAFYVMAMRQRALPGAGATSADPPLAVQATSSDADLARWLSARGVAGRQLAAEVARLRRTPNIDSGAARRDSTL